MGKSYVSKYFVFNCDGKAIFEINPDLVKTQGIDETTLAEIKDVHQLRLAIMDLMFKTDSRPLLKSLAKDLTICEFELQSLWGFKKNRGYHRFWLIPKCECPKMDNEDRYPNRAYVISTKCPIHGY